MEEELQQQLEAQDKIPDMRDWERLLERLEWEKRMSNCLGEAAVHAQDQEDKLKEEIVNLKKQLQYVNEELEDWKQQYKELEKELKEAEEYILELKSNTYEYMDIDYDRDY